MFPAFFVQLFIVALGLASIVGSANGPTAKPPFAGDGLRGTILGCTGPQAAGRTFLSPGGHGMDARDSRRVVLVHDWLTGMRGGEKVLEPICSRWPQAPLYTLLHALGSVSKVIEDRPIRTSFLQKLPGIRTRYRYALPLMPWAVNWRLPACDLVLSSSHCVAKGATAPPGAMHVCYCHTPMRYAWNMRDAYFGRGGLKNWAIHKILDRLREWDRRTASGVDHFIANSEVVRRRIRECYDRDAVVIHPPVDTDFYFPSRDRREDYYLVLSAFAPYKRLDLAVEACQKAGKKLVVIGAGQDEAKLQNLAAGNTTFLGWQSNEAIRQHLRRCQALLFPGEEDFGIVPVEAQACGTPVIALGKGGATETVLPLGRANQPTGVWFEEQTVDGLIDAMDTFDQNATEFDPAFLRRHAERFCRRRFEEELFGFIDDVMGRSSDTPRRQAA